MPRAHGVRAIVITSPSCGIAPNSGSGGETYERELLLGLHSWGDVEPHVLLAKGKPHPPELGPLIEPIWIRRGLRWAVMPLVMPPFIARCARAHRPALLRAHSVRFLGPAILLARRLYGIDVPVVVHAHHLEPGVLTRALERPVLRAADLVIADSRFAAQQVQALTGGRAKTVVVHCGAGEQYRPRSAEPIDGGVVARYGLSGTRRTCLAVGPLIARKDPLRMVRLFSRLARRIRQGVILVWLGAGPLRDAALALADGLGVGDLVRFPGHVPEADKLALYRLSDVFLHTSRLEGFPLAVLEAMASGLPVVAYDAASLPELIEHNRSGYLAHTDPEFLEQAWALVGSRQLRERIGLEAAARIDRSFRWEGTVRGVRAAYQELTARPNGDRDRR